MIQLLAHLAAVARDLVAEVQQADMLEVEEAVVLVLALGGDVAERGEHADQRVEVALGVHDRGAAAFGREEHDALDQQVEVDPRPAALADRKSTRLNSSP